MVGAPAQGGSQSATSRAGSAPGVDWSRVVRRSLRGRYTTTVTLATVAAGTGAAIGWHLSKPLFRSEGMVRIASVTPAVLRATDQNQPIPMFDSFIQAQQELITSRTVLEAAVEQAIWNSPTLSAARPSAEDLAAGLKVDVRPKSENLRITFIHTDPAVASAAVKSTITAYRDVYTQEIKLREQQRMQLLENYRDSLASQLEQGRVPMPVLAPTTLPSTTPALASGEATITTVAPIVVEVTAEELAATDGAMRRLLEERSAAEFKVEEGSLTFGKRHPVMVRLMLALDRSSQRVDRRLREYNAEQTAIARAAALAEAARAELTAAKAGSITDTKAPTPLPTEPTPQIAFMPLTPSMLQVQNELDDVTRRIDLFKTEAAMPKRFEIVSDGDFPVVVPDRRAKATGAGAVAGGGFAVGAMIVAGMFRRRYRYCADVLEDFTSRGRFVAAIPQVSADATDRWSDAAQCVHHLRQTFGTRPQVQLITSAGWAEGRTSMAMALALSLSGSGTRTLLIDGDLTQRGLTRSLDLDAEPGLLELLKETSTAGCIRKSSDTLSILPIGQGTVADGATIAATSLKRLFDQLRAKFDVVLIDGGPVMSCIETSTMASQADGVLMVVGRDQQQSIVRQAMAELASCEATLTGTVFNSAIPADFDRAVHRRGPSAALHLRAYELPSRLNAFGPLVHAVSASMRLPFELNVIPSGSPPLFLGPDAWAERAAG